VLIRNGKTVCKIKTLVVVVVVIVVVVVVVIVVVVAAAATVYVSILRDTAGSAVAEGGKAAPSLVHATQPLSPMSGREFDPYSANQKPTTFDEVAQQKVLSSFGVAGSDGLCQLGYIFLFFLFQL